MAEEKILKLTQTELEELIKKLEQVYDVVRIIDPLQKKKYNLAQDGCMQCDELKCYMMWNRAENTKCQNCSSSRAITYHSKETKFEFMNEEVYQVVSQYMEVDGKPLVLEQMNHIKDETLMDANGTNTTFVETILKRNKILFDDALTGAANRRCYEEQFRLTHLLCGVAMIDMDNFKLVNDQFGHEAGDEALKALVDICNKNVVLARDSVIRFGGDEFILICRGISKEQFTSILENIRNEVSATTFEDYPDLKITASIGGIYGIGTVEDMLKLADKALYESKIGKNQSLVYDYVTA